MINKALELHKRRHAWLFICVVHQRAFVIYRSVIHVAGWAVLLDFIWFFKARVKFLNRLQLLISDCGAVSFNGNLGIWWLTDFCWRLLYIRWGTRRFLRLFIRVVVIWWATRLFLISQFGLWHVILAEISLNFFIVLLVGRSWDWELLNFKMVGSNFRNRLFLGRGLILTRRHQNRFFGIEADNVGRINLLRSGADHVCSLVSCLLLAEQHVCKIIHGANR